MMNVAQESTKSKLRATGDDQHPDEEVQLVQVGLIGDPVAHSRSPAMQNAAFAALGIAAHYALWPTVTADLAPRIAALRQPDCLGANVTIPHKRAVMPLLDALADSAVQVGAVNTIVNRAGHLMGYNTDADGLVAALREAEYPQFGAGIIVGAGGAARAAAVALAALHTPHLRLLARDPLHARVIALTLAPLFPATRFSWHALVDATWSSLPALPVIGTVLINATPVGMATAPGMPITEHLLRRMPGTALVLDLITHDTPLLTAARARNLPVMNGLPMLLQQGALAFALWTGQPAPLAVMRAALDRG